MRGLRRGRFVPMLGLAAVSAILLLAGCAGYSSGGGGGASPPGATNSSAPAAAATATGSKAKVVIQNFTFSPKTLTVKPGATVTWTNQDTTSHTVQSTAGSQVGAQTTNLFASQALSQGQSFSHTFTKKGTFFYECTIHASMPSMHAVIQVK